MCRIWEIVFGEGDQASRGRGAGGSALRGRTGAPARARRGARPSPRRIPEPPRPLGPQGPSVSSEAAERQHLERAAQVRYVHSHVGKQLNVSRNGSAGDDSKLRKLAMAYELA